MTNSADTAWHDTFDEWMTRVRADLARPLDPHIHTAAADVAEMLLCEPEALPCALRRMGTRLGSDGWTIEQLQRWLALLEEIVDPGARRLLRSYTAQSALAEGWAKEMVRGAGDDRFIDPVSGLATAVVLKRRVDEVVRESAANGTTPRQTHCLVIVEPALGDLDALRRDSVLALLGRLVIEVFDGDETIVCHRHRIVVLADNLPTTGSRALRLERLARHASSGIPGDTIVWVDQLPAATDRVARYVRELLS